MSPRPYVRTQHRASSSQTIPDLCQVPDLIHSFFLRRASKSNPLNIAIFQLSFISRTIVRYDVKFYTVDTYLISRKFGKFY